MQSVVTVANALTGEALQGDERISLVFGGQRPSCKCLSARERQEDALVGALRNTRASGMLPEEMVVIARFGPSWAAMPVRCWRKGYPIPGIDGKSRAA